MLLQRSAIIIPGIQKQILTIIELHSYIAIVYPQISAFGKFDNRIYVGFLKLATIEQITLDRKEKLKKICQISK